MHKYANFVNNGGGLQFGLFASIDDGEHIGVGLVEKSKTIAIPKVFYGLALSDTVYSEPLQQYTLPIDLICS